MPTLNPRPDCGSQNTRLNGVKHMRSRSSIDGLGIDIPPLDTSSQGTAIDDETLDILDEEDDNSADRKLRAEAKSNRKVSAYMLPIHTATLIRVQIADLEITNRSLLAINITLEATKHRQAKEIRDLRRRLRESILILPPVAYHAAKSSMVEDGTLKEDEDEEEGEDEHAEDDPHEQAVLEGKTDESYRRVRSLLENLLESGRQALQSTPDDFRGSGASTKVLSEEEARTWRGDDPETRPILEEVEDGDSASFVSASAGDDDSSRPLTPSRNMMRISMTSEEEVEASLVLSSDDSENSAFSLPPITVTPSPSM